MERDESATTDIPIAGTPDTQITTDIPGLWAIIVDMLPETPEVLAGINSVIQYVWTVTEAVEMQQEVTDPDHLARAGMLALAIVSDWIEPLVPNPVLIVREEDD